MTADHQRRQPRSVPPQVAGDGTPDLVARKRRSVVVVPEPRHRRDRPADRDRPGPVAAPNLVLNAGDWDRDGYGDVITRNKKTGALVLRRGDGTGQFAKPIKLAGGFSKRRPAGRGRRHDRRRLPGPDGAARRRVRSGSTRAGAPTGWAPATSRTAGSTRAARSRSAAGTPTARRTRCSATATELTLFPGNGPGGLTGAQGAGRSTSRRTTGWSASATSTLTGHADLVVREKATGDLYLLQGTATGFAAAAVPGRAGWGPTTWLVT